MKARCAVRGTLWLAARTGRTDRPGGNRALRTAHASRP